jgi:glycosyltransferase involved in cell wall biosynthesis
MRLAPKSRKKKIVVDLTPLLPGGDNGGAKVMTLQLIKELRTLAPDFHFVLLTMPRTREELRSLEAANVTCEVVTPPGFGKPSPGQRLESLLRSLPARVRTPIAHILLALRARLVRSARILRRLNADLLFCPFTAPYFADRRTPVLSVIYDLQYAAYPHFFSEAERAQRHFNFSLACAKSARIACISGFVRSAVLQEAKVAPDKVKTIYIRLGHRLIRPEQTPMEAFLGRLGLSTDRYLLYPANFWEHKNHRVLLVAFGMFCARNPNSDLKLVCSGAPGPGRDYFVSAAAAMGLADKILFPGYVSDADFAYLLHGCRALIFPSLFEGFGMPVIEAMAAGKPVACANATSLPEIAQDAALFFDAKLPASVCNAIERLDREDELIPNLIEKGKRNAARFGDASEMAREYLALMQDMLPRAQA